jgi:hypothetical protein
MGRSVRAELKMMMTGTIVRDKGERESGRERERESLSVMMIYLTTSRVEGEGVIEKERQRRVLGCLAWLFLRQSDSK